VALEWFSSASDVLINKNDFAKGFEDNEQNYDIIWELHSQDIDDSEDGNISLTNENDVAKSS